MSESLEQYAAQVMVLQERLIELEQALSEQSWERLSGQYEREFSRAGLREINRWSRLMMLKNPLIRRGMLAQVLYVFGQGVQINGRNDKVNAVVQAFLDDAQNQAELTSHQARELKETDLALFGNLYFVFFANRATGRVRVRSINEDEIEEIICDPEDSKRTWFYKRIWNEARLDLASGRTESTQQTAFYPDWLYQPRSKPSTIGGHSVKWDTPIFHVKTGGLSDMRFGVSEIYSAIDWAKAYKSFLEDWATLTRAYSRFAHKMTVPGGKSGIAAAKAKMNTTVSTSSGGIEMNPPPTVGSMFISQPGVDLQPMRIGGANVSAEDGRRLMLMVASAFGLPESFFGDVSVGNLATAKSLDRPTELKMISRQTLWAGIYQAICGYVVYWAVRAPGGALHGMGQVIDEEDGTPKIVLVDEAGEPIDVTVDVMFPPILEHDVDTLISSVVSAATLDGKTLAGTMDARTVSRLLLSALGVKDIDELLDKLFPPEEAPQTADEMRASADEPAAPTAEAMMVEAVRELRGVVARLAAD